MNNIILCKNKSDGLPKLVRRQGGAWLFGNDVKVIVGVLHNVVFKHFEMEVVAVGVFNAGRRCYGADNGAAVEFIYRRVVLRGGDEFVKGG